MASLKSLLTVLVVLAAVLALLAPSCVAQITCGQQPQIRDILYSGQRLASNEFLLSSNQRYGLIMRCDCNLELYNIPDPRIPMPLPPAVLIWQSDTHNAKSNCVATLSTTGHFVIRGDGGWSQSFVKDLNTPGPVRGDYQVQLQDDGKLVVVYSGVNYVVIYPSA